MQGSPSHRDSGATHPLNPLHPEERAVRRELCRRKSDDSEGRYLHPHNQAAWSALLEGGYIERHEVFSDDGYEDGETHSLDDSHLMLVLALYPNP